MAHVRIQVNSEYIFSLIMSKFVVNSAGIVVNCYNRLLNNRYPGAIVVVGGAFKKCRREMCNAWMLPETHFPLPSQLIAI
jgi:hypothetical protein